MNNHLEVSLIAQSALSGLDAGFGNVFGVEANGGGRSGRGGLLRFREGNTLLGEEKADAAAAKAPFFGGLLEFSGDLIFVLKPPFDFFSLRGEGGNLQMALGSFLFDHRSPAFRSR